MEMERIEIIQGDITKIRADAIVNAANTSLMGGGGVDGAIHRSAGPELEFACQMLNGCKTGQAKITPGFRLPASFIIHTVGPVWRGGDSGEAELLASCYRSVFAIAQERGLKTLAFPSISTGIYGYPIELAAPVALEQTRIALAANPALQKVTFVCFEPSVFQCYTKLLPRSSTNSTNEA